MDLTATEVKLRSGERVGLAVVQAPDPEWAGRIEPMLRHKGPPWTWQNAELLRTDTGLEARFFVLHREGAPFANIMLVETGGVALLGHVWTEPADRGGGASGLLMQCLLDDFDRRGGRAIYLGTEPDSPPWHYYRRRGFEPVESGSGDMVLLRRPRELFEAEWFAAEGVRTEALGWPHWPAAAPLATGDFPGAVRLAATRLIGRRLNEAPFLPVLQEQFRRHRAGGRDCAAVLANRCGAVLGWASCLPDPIWPDRSMVDLYCHPSAWGRAGELLRAVVPGSSVPMTACCDAGHEEKEGVLAAAGFRPVATLPRWIAPAHPGADRRSMVIWESAR